MASPLRCLLLTLDPAAGPHAHVKTFLDGRPEVLHWHTPMLRTFFLVTRLTPARMTDLLRDKFTSGAGRFVVAEVTIETLDGWLPPDSWEFLRDPKPFKRQPDEPGR